MQRVLQNILLALIMGFSHSSQAFEFPNFLTFMDSKSGSTEKKLYRVLPCSEHQRSRFGRKSYILTALYCSSDSEGKSVSTTESQFFKKNWMLQLGIAAVAAPEEPLDPKEACEYHRKELLKTLERQSPQHSDEPNCEIKI